MGLGSNPHGTFGYQEVPGKWGTGRPVAGAEQERGRGPQHLYHCDIAGVPHRRLEDQAQCFAWQQAAGQAVGRQWQG